VLTCPSCGQENPQGFRFCGNCAAPLEPQAVDRREERKVVTVLFCDLVGSTARAERLDPEDVRALLSRYHEHVREELERFGGTVEKFIGDAVMALFGAPVAHEDDPERAVRAALAVCAWAAEEPEVQVRIGVTTGEALVALGVRPELGEGMAAGDVVNTAARLQSAAPVNGIVVDETTFRATERVVAYEPANPVEAKGKAEPIPVWSAVAARSRLGVDVRRIGATPLVGRERERAALSDAFARAEAERSPQLVTLVGVPGIGKSRLVWELFRDVEQRSELVAWRQGRSLPYGEGVAFWALGEIVKAQAGILETDPEPEAASKLELGVRGVLADERDAAWATRHLRPLVGLERGGEVGDRGEAFAAWRRFLEAIAEERPLVLVFEDLQFADDGLLDFVDHLVDWASGVPLLVLATARPELLTRRPAWGGGKPNAATLSLSPLSDEDTARLVYSLLDGGAIEPSRRQTLLERAGGNPLYAEEFTRLVARGEEPAVLPETVQGIVAARLDLLPQEEKRLLHDAAVLGSVVWLGALASLDRGEPRLLEERLHALERKEFLRRERASSVAGETEYAFRHVLVRDVAYGQIPRAERAEKHRAAAAWIESMGRPEDQAELLAHHHLAALELTMATGGDTRQLVERARVALRQAADRALGLHANRAAARSYERALELTPDGDDARPELLLGRARALNASDDPHAEAALEGARDALLAAGERARAAETCMRLGRLWWFRGRRDLASQFRGEALQLVAKEPSSPEKARVLAWSANLLLLSGASEAAKPPAYEALALAEELGLDDVRLYALATVAALRCGEGDLDGFADFERAVAIARAVDSSELARLLGNYGATLEGYDLFRGLELREEAIREAERIGQTSIARFSRAAARYWDYDLGEWNRFQLFAADAAAEQQRLGPAYMDQMTLGRTALIALARGNDEAALDAARSAVALAEEIGDPQARGPAHAVAAFVGSELGLAEARQHGVEALGSAAAGAAPSVTVPPVLAVVAAQLGLEHELRELVAACPLFQLTSSLLSFLDRDYAGAADLFAERGFRTLEAHARLRAGEEGDEAQLERSVAFFRSVGAVRYLRRGEAVSAGSRFGT
jgi:class 3 adenylate cyclase